MIKDEYSSHLEFLAVNPKINIFNLEFSKNLLILLWNNLLEKTYFSECYWFTNLCFFLKSEYLI